MQGFARLAGRCSRSISPGRPTAVVPVVASAIPATATAPVIAAAASLLFFGLLDGHFFPFEVCNIQGLYCFAGFVLVGHVHKAEAPALSGLSVHNYFGGTYFAIQFKHFF